MKGQYLPRKRRKRRDRHLHTDSQIYPSLLLRYNDFQSFHVVFELTSCFFQDNEINVKVAVAVLKRLGYETDVACDGQVAVDACGKKKYSVILMDMNMPVKDGLEATKEICELFPDPKERPCIIAMYVQSRNSFLESRLMYGFF